MSDSLSAFSRHAAKYLSGYADAYREKTGRGGAGDWSEYRYRVGYAAGIEEAAKLMQAVAKDFVERLDEA